MKKDDFIVDYIKGGNKKCVEQKISHVVFVFFGDGGCPVSMRENFYVPATKKQIQKRLEKKLYQEYYDIMNKYLKMPLPTINPNDNGNIIGWNIPIECCESNE